jgi:deuterolysin
MISNILPIVALTGVAMAGCPLSVAIVDAVDHTASVTVTNTGSEALTVFKGNTVLNGSPTKDLHVTDAGIFRVSPCDIPIFRD